VQPFSGPSPWNSRPYITVSDLRLPFSSPPTTRMVTVEVFDPAPTRVMSFFRILHLYLLYNCQESCIEDTALNTSSVILSVVTGILCLATCYVVTTRSLISVVNCVFVAMVVRVYQTVVQQRSIPRCHGNVLSKALPSRWSYSGFQASRQNIIHMLKWAYICMFLQC
jgi:hypothetical protein